MKTIKTLTVQLSREEHEDAIRQYCRNRGNIDSETVWYVEDSEEDTIIRGVDVVFFQ